MKRKPRKLALNRETLRALADRPLRHVAGGNTYTCATYQWQCATFDTHTDWCDTDYECSGGCDLPTNIWYACG